MKPTEAGDAYRSGRAAADAVFRLWDEAGWFDKAITAVPFIVHVVGRVVTRKTPRATFALYHGGDAALREKAAVLLEDSVRLLVAGCPSVISGKCKAVLTRYEDRVDLVLVDV